MRTTIAGWQTVHADVTLVMLKKTIAEIACFIVLVVTFARYKYNSSSYPPR
jgi:hypothetical protein